MAYNASVKISISQGSLRSAEKAGLRLRDRCLGDDPKNLIEVMLAKEGRQELALSTPFAGVFFFGCILNIKEREQK